MSKKNPLVYLDVYQSIDSAHLMAYGLFGHTSNKFENRSFDMFIPLVFWKVGAGGSMHYIEVQN
ncbi:hypothetical protein Ccrd_026625 [Cynara cardunculus var. scolymus]|uniref:Uncharacterized protein n=1 Tax=Cynara cardunculus var. scolymus TaxID=59895 RepID=A0A124QLX9_CYNCS|nr:hypothetical protein Ccrd_026625 [Cynara cardunculus var. scolymus]